VAHVVGVDPMDRVDRMDSEEPIATAPQPDSTPERKDCSMV